MIVHLETFSSEVDVHADLWLRVRTLAGAITPDVNLADDVAVTHALFSAGFVSADFKHLLSLAIERARKNRELGL